jgi:hypothetical protein
MLKINIVNLIMLMAKKFDEIINYGKMNHN